MHSSSTTLDVSAVSARLRQATETMDGLEFLNALVSGDLPESPLQDALEVRTVAAERGEVTLRTVPRPQHFNTIGTGHGGFLSALLDSATGLAVSSMATDGTVWTTTDLHVRFRRPMTADSGTVTTVGRVEHYGRSLATASGEVRDEQGRVLATATASLFALKK